METAAEQRESCEWSDATWNPVRGCTRVSPGCDRCYAAAFAERWRGVAGHAYERGFDPRPEETQLALPLSWTRSRRVFVASLSDLFHERVPDRWIARVFDAMELADWHVYHVLTKRAERMRAFVRKRFGKREPPGHVRLGVSVEDREHGVPRIAKLRATPAALRFLFLEPLLEDVGELDLDGIGWVLVGGESGPGARPLEREWVLSVRRQCRAARVPFTFKQWSGLRNGMNGRELQGRTYDELPRSPRLVVPATPERRRRREQLLAKEAVR